MPREGRELYELQYGAKARQMLKEALEASDASGWPGVVERVAAVLSHRSGYEATFLLGLYYFDHGRAMLGARTLQRLAEAGQSMEEFEPALSLTMATCWLQAGVPDKPARFCCIARAAAGIAREDCRPGNADFLERRRGPRLAGEVYRRATGDRGGRGGSLV